VTATEIAMPASDAFAIAVSVIFRAPAWSRRFALPTYIDERSRLLIAADVRARAGPHQVTK
jgi:hypothetical protein